ncbi:hypothetical protein MesoLjLa_66230 (plasmid) [Mesorhizobium sp. L-2-11]|nr:hypothetical protein MesoLjLa_66230 [Mesorhizobium sp. L-2-11]
MYAQDPRTEPNIGNNNQGQEERSFGSEGRRWRYPRGDRRLRSIQGNCVEQRYRSLKQVRPLRRTPNDKVTSIQSIYGLLKNDDNGQPPADGSGS